MLRVSSRVHYGLRVMTRLARAYGQRPVALSDIAAAERLPLPYLEQIVAHLRRAGLVEGQRGVHGGYRLTRPPEAISVAAVLQALEGALALVDCVAADYVPGSCAVEGDCLSRALWLRLHQAITAVLESTTLADLVRSERTDRGPGALAPVVEKVLAAAETAACQSRTGEEYSGRL